MKDSELRTILDNFGRDVIKHVAVQTHTDWSTYYEPVLNKHYKKLKGKIPLEELNGDN